MKRLYLIIMLVITTVTMNAGAIGTWNSYLAYHKITEIEVAGNMVYVLSSNGLYSYNKNDESVQTYDKMNVLNDCDISHIKWCNAAKKLVVIYYNNNMDLLSDKGDVINISDYYSKSMTEDKTINHIDIDGIFAYISTGFGIIKLNVANNEISDTYNLGFSVNYTYIEGDKIYAASMQNGLYSASMKDNLLDKNVWKRVGEYKPIEEKRNVVYDKSSNCYWTNDENGDLMSYREENGNITVLTTGIAPEGPKYNYFGFMRFYNDKLYTGGGGFTSSTDLNREGTVQIYDGSKWTILEDNLGVKTGHSYVDVGSVDVDPNPNNPEHIFVGSRCGLYEFLNGNFIKEYSFDNSPLKCASTVNPPSKDYVIVLSVKYDKEGNLWCLNSISGSTSLLKYSKEGTWTSHHNSELMLKEEKRSFERMQDQMFDSRGLMWFVNNYSRSPSLLCYQISTDALNKYSSFVNQDGKSITVTQVRCVAEDKSNNIWAGTNVGPLMLTADAIVSNSKIFTQVKVPRNDGTDYADYLLDGVDISCMAIDGGGRKWFGTNGNGVYLISEDNMTQIHHFTSKNSKLFSDNIETIAINDKTGEVFFGTDKGLCSFMSDASATNEAMTKDNVYAYPNPVEPGYRGLITVTGLTYNADVKIVTSNGVLVAQGRSNGGTFTWDGNDLKGKRVASGIYMVLAATAEGDKGVVCKIAIVN